MSRITKQITYSLHDRGRKHTGKDRSNVDVQAMIEKINSPAVQEQVESGTLNGFCGHQIRQLYGMVPPETVIIDGKTILIEPAIRTVYLRADEDGTVTHKQEFYENAAGEHVMRQYKAKIGGFSTAVNYRVDGMRLLPNIFAGFDYVFAPNFVQNASIGLFDSMNDDNEAMPLIRSMLEYELVSLYDSISESNQNYDYMAAMSERAREAEAKLEKMKRQTARRIQKAKQIEMDAYDSALLANTLNFDQQLAEAERFLNSNVAIEQEHKPQKQQNDRLIGGLRKLLGVAE